MTTSDIEGLLVNTLIGFKPDGHEWTQLVLMGGFETMMVKQTAFELNAKTEGVPQKHVWTTEFGRVDLGLADFVKPIGPDNLKYKAEFKINYVRQGLTNKTRPQTQNTKSELRSRLDKEITRKNKKTGAPIGTNMVVGLMMGLVPVEEERVRPSFFNTNAPKGILDKEKSAPLINTEDDVDILVAHQFPRSDEWVHGEVWHTTPWSGWRGRLQFVWKSLSR